MYWWNVDALVKDLRENRVSESDKFKYYMFYALATVITAIGTTSILSAFITALVIIWGIRNCHERNRAGDNKQFIERMVCLGLPTVVRLFAWALPILLLVFVPVQLLIMTSQRSGDVEAMMMYTVIFGVLNILVGILITLAYYLMLRPKISAVSGSRIS